MNTDETSAFSMNPPLVLASGSTTRAAMLQAAGVNFEIRRPTVDEEAVREALQAEGVSARDAATALAELKAKQVAASVEPGRMVLASDQILDLDGDWLGKPADRAEATQQLRRLRGRSHRLVSAAVLMRDGQRLWQSAEVARLDMREFSDAWLEAYLEACGDAVLGSVGAYQLEGLGAQMMSRVEGSHFAILGLPLLPLLQALRDQRLLAR